jgi:hypothetical protein
LFQINSVFACGCDCEHEKYMEENAKGFSGIPEYLSPYVTQNERDEMTEKLLDKYRVK